MTNSIKIKQSRAFLAILGFVLALGAAGCSSVFSGGCGKNDSSTCWCLCSNTGAALFCGSQTDTAGTQACETDCDKTYSTTMVSCNDSSDHPLDPNPDPNPPVCSAGEGPWQKWVVCEMCNDVLQATYVEGGCTYDDAVTAAQNAITDLSEECTLDKCGDQD